MNVKMKAKKQYLPTSNFILTLFLLTKSFCCLYSTNLNKEEQNLSFKTTTTFYEFFQENEGLTKEKWAWVGLIIFKNKKPVHLKKINLEWSGNFLDTQNISASLYKKKETQQQLIPVEKNFICDGKWNQQKQEIIFELNEKLIATTKYYLIINFPEKIKLYLKSGAFVPTKMITE